MEPVLYESGVIAVTRSVARFSNISYQISNISSVSITETPRLHPATLVLAIVGVFALAVAYVQYGQNNQMALWALITGIVALPAAMFWQSKWPKREFKFVLKTSAGESYVLTSEDRDVFKLKAAIEDAFVKRI